MDFFFCVGGDLVFECLSCGLLGVLLGPGGQSFCLSVISLFSVLAIDMFAPSLCEFHQILLNCGDWHFGLWVREWAVAWVGWACFFSSCNSPVPVSCSILWLGCSLRDFLLYVFSFAILPMPVLEIEIPALHIRENSHLSTMGEQCCALNGLHRFVNKNE